MESVSLTAALIRAARPRDREYAIADTACPGLMLRVQPGGARSFVIRHEGRRVTLGRIPGLTLRDARIEARAILRLGKGSVPSGTMRFRDLTEAYLKSKTGILRESTLAATRTYLRSQLLPALGETPIDRLEAPDIADWFHSYSRLRPGGANEALGKLRAILDYASEQGFLDPQHPDPTAPLRRNPRPPRGRLLTSAQLKRLGEILTDPPSGTSDAARAIRLILLTGCRPFEIARLTWPDIAPEHLTLGQTKTGPRVVLLSEEAQRFIARLRKRKRGQDLFPDLTSGARGHFRRLWEKIRSAADLPGDIRLHDLRHSYASHAIMKGETLYATGKLLGHSGPDSTKCYAHLEDRHLAKAAEKLSARIAKLMSP